MPAEFTCEGKKFGEGVSPELHWTDGPINTQSYAVVLRDWTAAGAQGYHWAMWNIPEAINLMPTKLVGTKNPTGMGGAEQKSAGTNGFSYFAPCPSNNFCTDKIRVKHNYSLIVYALSQSQVAPGATVQNIDTFLSQNALAKTEVKFTSDAAPSCATSSSSSSSSSTSSSTSSGSVVDGAALFVASCGSTSCHTANKLGAGPLDVSDRSAALIKSAIQTISVMKNRPAVASLTDVQINAIVAAISTSASSSSSSSGGPLTGADLFRLNCGSCHKANGLGSSTRGGDVTNESASSIREAIAEERDMRFLSTLTTAEINAIAAAIKK